MRTILILLSLLYIPALADDYNPDEWAYVDFEPYEVRNWPNLEEAAVRLNHPHPREEVHFISIPRRSRTGTNSPVSTRVDNSRLVRPVSQRQQNIRGHQVTISTGGLIKGSDGKLYIVRLVFPNGRYYVQEVRDISISHRDPTNWTTSVRTNGDPILVNEEFVLAASITENCYAAACIGQRVQPQGERLEDYNRCVNSNVPHCGNYCEKFQVQRVVFVFSDLTSLVSQGSRNHSVNLEPQRNDSLRTFMSRCQDGDSYPGPNDSVI